MGALAEQANGNMVDSMTETWFPQDMTTERTVYAGRGDYEIVNLPRFKAHFTAYVGPNDDGSSSCITIDCDHLHRTRDEAKACCERLRRRVERHPEQFPAVARALEEVAR